MALDQSALLEIVEMMRSADDGELMRRLLGTMMQALVDAEATEFIGAEPHQRTEERTTQRNGSRDKLVTTAAGDLTVKIPKVRTGSFFPALLAPRRRIDVALHAVICQALRRRCQHPAGRRPGRGGGRHRHQRERGQPDLRSARRGRRRLAQPAAERDRSPLRLPRRHLLEGPQ